MCVCFFFEGGMFKEIACIYFSELFNLNMLKLLKFRILIEPEILKPE